MVDIPVITFLKEYLKFHFNSASKRLELIIVSTQSPTLSLKIKKASKCFN